MLKISKMIRLGVVMYYIGQSEKWPVEKIKATSDLAIKT